MDKKYQELSERDIKKALMPQTIERAIHHLPREIKVPTEFPPCGKWSKTQEVELDLSTLGAMSYCFTKVTLRVNFAEVEGIWTYVNLAYSYKHPSGSNGYTSCIVINHNDLSVTTQEGWAVLRPEED